MASAGIPVILAGGRAIKCDRRLGRAAAGRAGTADRVAKRMGGQLWAPGLALVACRAGRIRFRGVERGKTGLPAGDPIDTRLQPMTARLIPGGRTLLPPARGCSHYVLMVVETLGDAFAAGWRLTARCAWGKREGMKTKRECHYTRELDLETLVWTRGPNFPLSSLDGRLMCPRCRSRRVAVLFQPPTVSNAARG